MKTSIFALKVQKLAVFLLTNYILAFRIHHHHHRGQCITLGLFFIKGFLKNMLNKKGQLVEDASAAVLSMPQQQEHPKRLSMRPVSKVSASRLIDLLLQSLQLVAGLEH